MVHVNIFRLGEIDPWICRRQATSSLKWLILYICAPLTYGWQKFSP